MTLFPREVPAENTSKNRSAHAVNIPQGCSPKLIACYLLSKVSQSWNKVYACDGIPITLTEVPFKKGTEKGSPISSTSDQREKQKIRSGESRQVTFNSNVRGWIYG
jgi:hypothetical protein